MRRELLRWRDLVAGMWLEGQADPAAHVALWRSLLLLTPGTAAQIEL